MIISPSLDGLLPQSEDPQPVPKAILLLAFQGLWSSSCFLCLASLALLLLLLSHIIMDHMSIVDCHRPSSCAVISHHCYLSSIIHCQVCHPPLFSFWLSCVSLPPPSLKHSPILTESLSGGYFVTFRWVAFSYMSTRLSVGGSRSESIFKDVWPSCSAQKLVAAVDLLETSFLQGICAKGPVAPLGWLGHQCQVWPPCKHGYAHPAWARDRELYSPYISHRPKRHLMKAMSSE